jgi:LacI family transcriptional regulator
MRRLLDQEVDGVILPPPLCDSRKTVERLAEAHVPVLALATAAPLLSVSAVRIDDFRGALTMTRHLIRLGHRRIGFIKGDPHHTPTGHRFAGFLKGMEEAGLVVDVSLIRPGLFTFESGLKAAEALLKRADRPTAVFASNDDMAAAVIALAHGLQIRIPEDISIAGFDDTPVASIMWPQITTIHQPIAAMGRAAVTTIFEKVRDIRAGRALQPRHLTMKCSLIDRASTGPAP